MCLKMAGDKLTAIDKQNWQTQLLNVRNDSKNSNKLRTYRTYKTIFTTERILAKFRSCNLPLAVETGRYTKPKTPMRDRLYKFCIAAVENEMHFLIDCAFYSDIRCILFQCANILNRDFISLTSGEKLIFRMQNSDPQQKLASSLLLMCSRRRSTAN